MSTQHWARGKRQPPVLVYDPKAIDADALALTLGPVMPGMFMFPAYGTPQQSIEVFQPERYARSSRYVSHAPRAR